MGSRSPASHFPSERTTYRPMKSVSLLGGVTTKLPTSPAHFKYWLVLYCLVFLNKPRLARDLLIA